MRKIIGLIITIFLLLIIMSLLIPSTYAEEGLASNARSAILVDAGTGTVLFNKNENEKMPLASVTKIMTMLLVMEDIEKGKISLTDEVTISEKASSMGGSQLFLEPYEKRTVDELMMGVAIASANDGCVALAEYTYGSSDEFVKAMNSRAKELGMKNTNFVNTNGLPADNHYSTAYDISLMSRELIKHDKIFDWLTVWMKKIMIGKNNDKEFEMVNTNRLIRFYDGANGIKTGFTSDAMYCLSASATRGDMTLISVALGEPTSNIRNAEIAGMLDYGFAQYSSEKFCDKREVLTEITLLKSSNESLELLADDDLYILTKKGETGELSRSIELKDDIKLPIMKGDALGTLTIVDENGKEYGSANLLAEEDRKVMPFYKMFVKVMGDMFG